MKKKLVSTLLILLCLALPLGACSPNSKEGLSKIMDERIFIDDTGVKFVVNAPYRRIISMYSAHTENLYALGAGKSLIGVGTTSTYPPEAAFLPMYDYRADPEAIIAAQPDLVILRPFINRNYPDFVNALKNAGLNVVSLYPMAHDDFDEYIRILAMLTGTQARAEAELALLRQRLSEIQEKVGRMENKPAVFFEATEAKYRSVAPGSNPAIAIELAGGVNVAADAVPTEKGSSIAEYGIERLLMNAESIDVYLTQRGAMNSGGSSVSISQRPGFKAIKAVRDGRILELNEKIISSPSSRYYKGVREIARMLYPEVMDDYSAYASESLLTRETYAIITVMFAHAPVFIPSSSHYYETDYYNHSYGLFQDVAWDDPSFDYIETAVMRSFIKGRRNEDGTEYFDKSGTVSKEDVAFTLYLMGDFQTGERHAAIEDLDACGNPDIVQKIVDSGIMAVDARGRFNPKETVSAAQAIEILERLPAYDA